MNKLKGMTLLLGALIVALSILLVLPYGLYASDTTQQKQTTNTQPKQNQPADSAQQPTQAKTQANSKSNSNQPPQPPEARQGPKVEVSTSVNKTSVYIGDPIEIKFVLSANKRFNVKIDGSQYSLGDNVDILDETRTEQEQNGKFTKTIQLRIAPFATGNIDIPAQKFICTFDDGSQTQASTKAIRIHVKSLLEEQARKMLKEKQAKEAAKSKKGKKSSTKIAPQGNLPPNMPDSIEELAKMDQNQQQPQANAKPNQQQKIELKLEPKDIKPPAPLMVRTYWLLYALLALLGLVVVAYVFARIKEHKQARALHKPAPPPEPAHVIALRRLEQLKESNYIAKRNFKLFYFLLSDIIREYLQNRYRFPAKEYTTSEILDYIRKNYPPNLDERMVNDILTPCDLVKFAGFTSSEEEAERLLGLAYELIERTRERTAGTEQKEAA